METIPVDSLRARLRSLSAVFQPDRSGDAHIYYSAPSRRWIKVVRVGPQHVRLTYHATCPCAAA